ncbi:MAG: adenosine deaminase [Anaerolineaceae bacterium]|nr:adenosine deaminase [Anaerolineaceae bacterium]
MIDSSIPLIDLHRHLDGSLRLETILDIGLKNNLNLPARDLEGLRPYVQVTDPKDGLLAFFEKFKWLSAVMLDYDCCRRFAYENVEDAFNEGIDYIELRFSPLFMASEYNLDPQGVTEAIIDGVKSGVEDFGVKAKLIGIISRTFGVEKGWKELDALLSQKDAITALDLAGDEANYPGELFVDHIRKGREAGWHLTIHAGEIAGPESIWQALKDLKAERIGHGVSAIQDEALMEYLVENKIGIESNLTSNVQTSTVPDYQSHPLKTFLEKGILATINTDDPGISAIDLPYEYETAAPQAGLSPELITQAQKNALEIAFLDDSEKQALLKK